MITPSFGLTATERVLPKLALDFTTASLDSRVTFSRALATATRVNSSGYIEAVAADAPRFDYNPVTLICKGLLIEEARTNILLYSQQLDDAVWLKAGLNTTGTPPYVDVAVSPDGTQNAEKIIEDTSTGSHDIRQLKTGSVSTTYTYSFYAKAAERSKLAVFIGGPSGAITFDLGAGTATGASGLDAHSITPVGNGWYRCTLTDTTTAGSGAFNAILILNNGSTTSYTGDGTSGLYIWGAQLEAGAFATSYIPTEASALTRNADVATMTGTNFSDWFNASEGTFVQRSTTFSTAANSTAVGVSDNSTANFMSVATRESQIRTGGVFQGTFATPGAPGLLANTFYQVALAYKTDDVYFATNGVAGTPDTTVTLPTVSQLRIGGLTTTGATANTIVSKILYYPMRLTNAEIVAFSKQG
jgi:hypothetical protein